MIPTTLSEARDNYEQTSHRVVVLVAQAETVWEALDAARGEDDEAEVLRLEALADTLTLDIEAAGCDMLAAGERLDAFDADPGDPTWTLEETD